MKAQIIEKTLFLNALDVKNENLYSILNDIIEHEKKCSYYTSELKFIFSIRTVQNITYIQIDAIGNQFRKHAMDTVMNIGVFEYQGHSFLVEGEIEETIFSITPNVKEYTFLFVSNEIDTDTGEVIFIIGEDDSFSYWGFKYINCVFVEEGISTYCE